MSFANIFSRSVACLLIHVILSLAEQKFLILRKYSLSIISFMDHLFGVVSKNVSPYPRSSRFSQILSSKSYIILCFTFRSMIYFKLFFVNGIRSVSRFIFYMWLSSCSSNICWRDYLCSTVLPLLLCQRSVDYIYGGLFLGSLFWSIDPFVFLSPIPHCLNYYSFIGLEVK